MARKLRIPPDAEDAKEFIDALRPKRAEYTAEDSVVPRLLLTVYPGGVKTFRMRIQVNGRRNWYKIANWGELGIEDARTTAARMLQKKAAKKVPTIDPVRACPSVGKVFEEAMEARLKRGAIKKLTLVNRHSALRAAGPKFLQRTLSDLTEVDLRRTAKLIRQTKGLSDSVYKNWRCALKDAYEYAMDNYEGVPRNLVLDIMGLEFDVVEEVKPGKRAFGWEVIRAFWQYLEDPRCPFSPKQRRALKLTLFTGQRVREASQASWNDIYLERGWWVVPIEKVKWCKKHTRDVQPHYIFLSEPLLDILGKPDGQTQWVFRSEKLKNKGDRHMSVMGISGALTMAFRVRACRNLKKVSKSEKARYSRFPIPEVVPDTHLHEISRHTMITHAQISGIPGKLVSFMVHHKLDSKRSHKEDDPDMAAAPTTRKYYTHIPYEEDLRIAWLKWAKVFCENVLGEVPQSVTDALEDHKTDEERVLDLIRQQFDGNLEVALATLSQQEQAGTVLHVVK